MQLSGGLDSSLVAACGFCQAQRRHYHGFYVSIDDRKCSEDRWANRTADLLCKRFHFQLHTISGDSRRGGKGHAQRGVVHGRARQSGTPTRPACTCCASTFANGLRSGSCSRAKRRTEMFGGYSWHDGRTIRDFDKPVRMFNLGGSALANARIARHRDIPALARQLYYDREVYMPPILLRQDRMSMAHGIEARVPFLSNRSLAMPPPAVPGKRVLKRQAAHVFGLWFAYRRKYGFRFPWKWFAELGVNREYTAWLSDRPVAKNEAEAWTLAAMGLWAKNYLFGGWRDWAKRQKNHGGSL